MRLKDLLEAIHPLAPLELAAAWDKVGLHVGDADQNVTRALLCIDLTEPVMAEAVKRKVELVIAYHPPIFEPIARLTGETWKGRVLREAVRRDIAVFSPHTALDDADGGINDWLASAVGEGEVSALEASETPDSIERQAFKIVTFVPADHVDRLRSAMAAAGAGNIGAYSKCSFIVAGEGTFQGDDTTSPTVGSAGQFERAAEMRMEMHCRMAHLGPALDALRRAHPYETPAIDVYEVMDADQLLDDSAPGHGRVVTLRRPVRASSLAARIKKHLGVARVEVATGTAAGGTGTGHISRVGVCAGAGGSLLNHDPTLDAFITGEMRHHDVLDAVQRGTTVILAGHTQTERPYLPVYRDRLAAVTGGGKRGVTWMVSGTDRAPSALM